MEETFYKPQNETTRYKENDIMIVSKSQFTDVVKLKNDIKPEGNG